jgi:hypothetical protein
MNHATVKPINLWVMAIGCDKVVAKIHGLIYHV